MAERIQARAIRREGELFEGELFKMIDSAQGKRTDLEPDTAADSKSGRKAAAESAGISQRQMFTAIRVANLDQDEFEAAVESDNPLLQF
jgi:hypothetical protein